MDETKRRLGLRAVLGVFAVVLAAAAFWAASAFAAGGSASGERGTSESPAAANVQNESEAPVGDCPNRGSDSESNSSA
jgi:nitrous oxide reductase